MCLTDSWETIVGCSGMSLGRSDCVLKCSGKNAEVWACPVSREHWEALSAAEGHTPRFTRNEPKRISLLDRFLSSTTIKTPLTPHP